MRRVAERWALALVVTVVVAVMGAAGVWPEARADGRAEGRAGAESYLAVEAVTIETAHGPKVFHAEIAATPGDRRRGLMYRTALAPDAAMLFDFKVAQPVMMWMRNTLIPLDMLFIAPDGTIIHIEHQAQPHDETPRGSLQPVLGVLEIAGGTARALGITEGDRVRHRLFED